MKKSLLSLLLGICFIPAFSQFTYNGVSVTHNGTLTISDPTYDRPNEGVPPTTLANKGKNVYYNLIPVVINATGLVDISTSSVVDNFLVMYSPAGFVSTTPLLHALVSNDDLVNTNAGFTYNFTSTGTYYLVISAFASGEVGAYSITLSPTVILPIKLKSFTAIKSNTNNVLINWSSENENNLNNYKVQRSADGKSFTDLANAPVAAKNLAISASYSITDNSPLSGYNYYRLKITEKSGSVTYSSVVFAKTNKTGASSIRVFPNPTADYLQIEAKSSLDTKSTISIINANGATLKSGQYNFSNLAVVTLNIKQLPAGKYFLKTVIDKVETTTLFIKN
jgi:hypothetical protein